MHYLCGVLPWIMTSWLGWLKCTTMLYKSLVAWKNLIMFQVSEGSLWTPWYSITDCDVMMYRYYTSEHNNCILLNPPIQFGQQSSYLTRTCSYFAAINRFKLSFSQKFFRFKGVHWSKWNCLPSKLFDNTSYSQFRHHLYGYLLSSTSWLKSVLFFICV